MSPDAVTLAPGGQLREELPFKPVRIAVITISDTRMMRLAANSNTKTAFRAGNFP